MKNFSRKFTKRVLLTIAIIFVFVFYVKAEAGANPGLASETAVKTYSKIPYCHLLALRKIMNDVNYTDHLLSNEVINLRRDTGSLYNSWQTYGRGYYSGMFQTSDIIRKRADNEQRNGDIWSLYSRVEKKYKKTLSASQKLMDLEKQWWYMSNEVKKKHLFSKDCSKCGMLVNNLKKDLSSLVKTYNEINSAVPSLQSELDYLRSDYLEYINRIQSDKNQYIDLSEPWHWVYRNSGSPRPDLKYDFNASYERNLAAARKELYMGEIKLKSSK